jgi:hypothetical protein
MNKKETKATTADPAKGGPDAVTNAETNKVVDPNTIPAAEQAAKDIELDPDLAPDESDTADLDEGELARADNSND